MTSGPSPSKPVTTRNPSYIRARKLLDTPGYEMSAAEAALVLGISDQTVRNYVRIGRLRATMDPKSGYQLSVNEIRRYLGIDPLPEL
jgi:excisionase family DNA binding protein